MDFSHGRGSPSPTPQTQSDEEMGIRKGPWTAHEDSLLFDYVTVHGEGRWNSVARCSGLKRTGKSCRLRWLNYLRPDLRRGNITLQEQLLILELHSRWGNRWSKIAQHLPGRTDNEIKNYWRTRVQKQAKQLKCDVSSKKFRDALRYVWIPRLMERIQATSVSHSGQPVDSVTTATSTTTTTTPVSDQSRSLLPEQSDSSDIRVASKSDKNGSVSCPERLTSGYEIVLEGTEEMELQSNVWGNWLEENIWFLQEQLFD